MKKVPSILVVPLSNPGGGEGVGSNQQAIQNDDDDVGQQLLKGPRYPSTSLAMVGFMGGESLVAIWENTPETPTNE